ncbi:MAG: hypothetical protein KGN34_02665 [Sphingomonadales bacterium]|nr:hypothetical protein [Sphingomonadales bacterium]
MDRIGKFLIERSAFAVVPILCVIAWNLSYIAAPREEIDPWGRQKPSSTARLAAVMNDIGEHLGIASAKAAGNGEATLAFRKARISAVYAGAGYRKKVAAGRLGMSVPQFQAALRRYGVIEWPEGHKPL